MTTAPAMPELPEPDYWSTRDDDTPLYTADQMRAYALATLSSQPSPELAGVSDAIINRVVYEHTKLNPNQADDLDLLLGFRKAVRAILALRPAQHPDTARCIKARNDLNAALHGEGALIDDLEHAVANACARLSRPAQQAVPMTDMRVLQSYRSSPIVHNADPLTWFEAGVRSAEAHHGITAQGAQGEQV